MNEERWSHPRRAFALVDMMIGALLLAVVLLGMVSAISAQTRSAAGVLVRERARLLLVGELERLRALEGAALAAALPETATGAAATADAVERAEADAVAEASSGRDGGTGRPLPGVSFAPFLGVPPALAKVDWRRSVTAAPGAPGLLRVRLEAHLPGLPARPPVVVEGVIRAP